MVRVCVLFAAGTNCDQETVHAFELAGAQTDTVHINRLKAKPDLLADYHILVIPGGFSYGDYIASGRILAVELVHHLRDALPAFLSAGKPVLGICNGFQALVKTGVLPGFDGPFSSQVVSLDWNDSGRFEDRWVHLEVGDTDCIFARRLRSGRIYLPVAHAEGKFIVDGQSTLTRLRLNRQVVFRYADSNGESAGYPENPNGSVHGIAAICDPSGLVMGMMPHPERFVRQEQHPHWHRLGLTAPDGIAIFESAVAYAKEEL